MIICYGLSNCSCHFPHLLSPWNIYTNCHERCFWLGRNDSGQGQNEPRSGELCPCPESLSPNQKHTRMMVCIYPIMSLRNILFKQTTSNRFCAKIGLKYMEKQNHSTRTAMCGWIGLFSRNVMRSDFEWRSKLTTGQTGMPVHGEE